MSRDNESKRIAFGGIFAALAVVVMCLGGLIAVATYASPLICTIILQIVLLTCGKRIAWAWYAAVSVLSMLLSADKEAVFVFVFLGYYPIVKPWFDKRIPRILWKSAYFSASVCVMYWMLMNIMGMVQLWEEFLVFGKIGCVVMLIAGNGIFILLDRLLTMRVGRRQ